MTARRLNRLLTLETPQRVSDGAGGFTQAWVGLGQLWADVRSRTQSETALGENIVARAAHEITVRGAPFGSEARPKHSQRFREGERIYRILSVTEADPSGRYLVCATIEEVAA
ncbi:MAG: head-tail adaptor protein [Pseudomonadota bacterium]